MFLAIIGSWVVADGSERIICIYTPNNHSDAVAFFDVIIAFVQRWECSDFLILVTIILLCMRMKYEVLMASITPPKSLLIIFLFFTSS